MLCEANRKVTVTVAGLNACWCSRAARSLEKNIDAKSILPLWDKAVAVLLPVLASLENYFD